MNLFKRDPDPFASSRYTSVFKSVRERQRRHMQKRWQWWVLGVFLILTVLGGAAAWKIHQFQERIQHDAGTTPEGEGEPFNVLLVGSDSRGDLTPEEQHELGANAVAGERADTLILAHVDPNDDHVIMVQFPRDLYVEMGDGAGKINEALLGGRKALVRTIEDLTGLTINRYIKVNIAGFRDVVDAIGGVDVCVPEEIGFDSNTGLAITEPGTIHFDGDLALRFVRSRHTVEGGDFGRIANQQKFLAAALNKVTSAGTLFQPQNVLELIDVAGDNLEVDMHTNLSRLRGILERFRSFTPERYEAYTVPNEGTGRVGEASVVFPDEAGMRFVFDALGRNESPAEADGVPNIDPHTVRVGVYNGVDLFRPYASDAAAALLEATGGALEGFRIDSSDIANAPHFKFKETLIRYEAGAEDMAELVAAVVPGATLQEHRTPEGVDVAVIVGDKGFKTETLVQILPIPIPPPGERPEVCEKKGKAVTG